MVCNFAAALNSHIIQNWTVYSFCSGEKFVYNWKYWTMADSVSSQKCAELSLIKAASKFKGIVQRIVKWVEIRLKKSARCKPEAQKFFLLNFKETPSWVELKTILSGLRIIMIALSGQVDSAVVYYVCGNRLSGIPLSIPKDYNPQSSLSHNMALRCRFLESWLSRISRLQSLEKSARASLRPEKVNLFRWIRLKWLYAPLVMVSL